MTSVPLEMRPAAELSAFLLELPDKPDKEHDVAALTHRQQLIKLWGILPGSTVLEIGPGQGDFTVALADALGPKGRVVAVDPAPLDQGKSMICLPGTPTFRSARAHVLASPAGSRIEFVQADPIIYLDSAAAAGSSFDYVILCHCIWYFSKPDIAEAIFSKARRVGTIAPVLLIAEYGLSASVPEALPHVFAAMALNALESFRGEESQRNIRCALSPSQITFAADLAGWKLVREDTVIPGARQRDGWREVTMLVKGKSFARHVGELGVDSKVKSMLLGLKDAVVSSVTRLDGGLDSVRNMDVWVARLEDGTTEEM